MRWLISEIVAVLDDGHWISENLHLFYGISGRSILSKNCFIGVILGILVTWNCGASIS
jgi:hypothetical protein